MTDKQIIIDGVDVSGCEHFEDEECLNPSETVTNCEATPNCYYKQLKRKEQECEELRSVRDSWISKHEQETKIRELYQDGLDQLKQAIARVKELIQKEINDCEYRDDCASCEYNCCIRQAMQICNEVISE